jgi:hypothetical protein
MSRIAFKAQLFQITPLRLPEDFVTVFHSDYISNLQLSNSYAKSTSAKPRSAVIRRQRLPTCLSAAFLFLLNVDVKQDRRKSKIFIHHSVVKVTVCI